MRRAVALVRREFESKGRVPQTVLSCLVQGPEEAASKVMSKLANLALVSALFIVGAIDALINLPEVLLEDDVPFWVRSAFTCCMHVSVAAFTILIVFFTHMANHLPKIMHHDADVITFFLETDFDSAFTYYCTAPLIVGVVLFLACVVLTIFATFSDPWIAVVAVGVFAPSINIVSSDKNFGYFGVRGGLPKFYRKQRKGIKVRVEYLLDNVYGPRAEQDPIPQAADDASILRVAEGPPRGHQAAPAGPGHGPADGSSPRAGD